MRELLAQGKSVAEVARLVGVEYQFAYGVAKRAGLLDASRSASRAQPTFTSPVAADVDIEGNLRTYLDDRGPRDRYASFDYCFNFFQRGREEGRTADLTEGPQLQLACLHLGFYLASWGMYRGSTILLKRSVAYLAPVVEVIAKSPTAAWAIDADAYTPEACALLLDTARQIHTALSGAATDTLVTKIMLGVFGSVPAYDTNFRNGFRTMTFGESSLMRVGRFCRENAEVIERYRVPTLDFDTGADTKRKYTRAKVIDMIFFIEGGATT